MYLSKTRTERGFQIIKFEDCYQQQCSIQQSSNLKKQIWLGADNVSYDEKDEPYNSRACLGRKEAFKVAFRLFVFSLTGKLFHDGEKKKKTVRNKLTNRVL